MTYDVARPIDILLQERADLSLGLIPEDHSRAVWGLCRFGIKDDTSYAYSKLNEVH